MRTARFAKKVFPTGSENNQSGFTTKAATFTRPSGNGIIDLIRNGATKLVPWGIKLWPLGQGSANDVYSLRVWGWNRVGAGSTSGKETIYFPTILGEFSCTLSAFTGLASGPVLNTDLFCDTITPVAARNPDMVIAAGTALQSELRIMSPANDTPGFIVMPIFGAELLEFEQDQTTNTPTMNCLYSLLDDDED